jgi:hypothetical protein
MAMYGSGSGTFSGSNSMGEYNYNDPYSGGVAYGDPMASFYDAFGSPMYGIPNSDMSGQQIEDRNMPPMPSQPPPAPPPENPLFAQARTQAQNDVASWGAGWNGGAQGGGYQTPQMNPFSMYGSSAGPFPWASFNGIFGRGK